MAIVGLMILFLLVMPGVSFGQHNENGGFSEVSECAGINANHEGSWNEYKAKDFSRGYLAMGQAWGDFDNDGWVDLYVTGGLTKSVLYQNQGDGTFDVSEFSASVGLHEVWTGGAVWADYDNDGWIDLYVLANGSNVLFHNEGGNGFRDVTSVAGVGSLGKSSGAAWGDYNGDSFLDLYVTNWSCFPDCDPVSHELASDNLYRNNGNGTFTEVSYLLDREMLQGAGFATSFADIDEDGDLDIYVVNDKLKNPIGNVLWRNDGAGCKGWCWTNASRQTKSNILKHGMGLAVGDYDNDLDLDLYFSDMVESMVLLENQGGSFRDVADVAGVASATGSTTGWGTAFFDFNNDGWLDIFLATTEFKKVYTIPVGMLFPYPNFLFENLGDGTFVDSSPIDWRQNPEASLGTAYADYDNDGYVDMVIGNWNESYVLYRNLGLSGTHNHWITIKLAGSGHVNRDAVGSRVYVHLDDGSTLMQEVKIGSSLGAGNDTALHFGLGERAIMRVEIVWPDGARQTHHNVTSNQKWLVTYMSDTGRD